VSCFSKFVEVHSIVVSLTTHEPIVCSRSIKTRENHPNVVGWFVGWKAEERMRRSGLNVLAIQKMSKAGRYADGNGLYLQITKTGTKSWIFRFMLNGKSREMGLGSVTALKLADARQMAVEYQGLLLKGIDPIHERDAKKKKQALNEARTTTFEECVKGYISAHSPKWSNQKHINQWKSTLATYASPVIGNLPVGSIDTDLVMKILDPIWGVKTETASRVRGRIEAVLDWSTVRQFRSGENPARWRGHLDKLLPKPTEVSRVKHFEALPIEDIQEFMFNLRSQEGLAPQALEFLILTASRTSEVLHAKWSEFDIEKSIWTIPPERMKHRKEHRVPLSDRCVQILRNVLESNELYEINELVQFGDFVFPGQIIGKPLSSASLRQIIKERMNLKITVHGFRSTFRDWASEYTNYSRETVEMAMAHTIESKVEAAYRRRDLFTKRKSLMADWEKFCGRTPSRQNKVVEMKPRVFREVK